MLEFTTKKLQIKFNEKIYSLSYPTVGALGKYNDEIAKNEKSELDLVIGLLDELGLSKSVSETMEMTHLNLIVEELIKTKK